jgi:hypothetical protein
LSQPIHALSASASALFKAWDWPRSASDRQVTPAARSRISTVASADPPSITTWRTPESATLASAAGKKPALW